MVYKQYLLLEFKLNPFGIAVTCDEQQYVGTIKGSFETYFELSASYKFHQNGFRTDLSNA